MTFDEWMLTQDAKYTPMDDTVALRMLRACWQAAQQHGEQILQVKSQLNSLIQNGLGISGHRVDNGADYYRCSACHEATDTMGFANAIGELNDVHHAPSCGLLELAAWATAPIAD